MQSLLSELLSYGVFPTRSMTRSLYCAAQAFEAMADETLSPQFHLSSLDPGVGKTTLIRHFIMALLASPHHVGVSVLVCVSRLEEIETMLAWLSPYQSEVSVWTGDEATNAKTSTPPQEARVLLTTQQKLEAVCGCHDRFAMAKGFHYLGHPREVRIWDESLLPGKEVMLSEDDLSGLWGHFRRSAPQLCDALQDLHAQLRQAAIGDIIHVPELEEMGGPTGSAEVAKLLASEVTTILDRERLERLQQAIGEALPVHRSNYGEAKLLDYRDSLREDLAPMVVFDASGRCRATYSLMERHRNNLVRLPSVSKDYSNLRIGLWSRGSGKTTHANDKSEVLVRGIAEKIMARPHEEWLILHHKDDLTSFQNRVEAHLGDGVTGQLHFLSWGKHHGTNAFSHVPNVIFASLLHLPPEVHETRVRLCAGMGQTEAVPAAILPLGATIAWITTLDLLFPITGLLDLAEDIEGMAEGSLPPRYYLSSLDPGVGKTTMVKPVIDQATSSDSVAFLALRDLKRFVPKASYGYTLQNGDRHGERVGSSAKRLRYSCQLQPDAP